MTRLRWHSALVLTASLVGCEYIAGIDARRVHIWSHDAGDSSAPGSGGSAGSAGSESGGSAGEMDAGGDSDAELDDAGDGGDADASRPEIECVTTVTDGSRGVNGVGGPALAVTADGASLLVWRETYGVPLRFNVVDAEGALVFPADQELSGTELASDAVLVELSDGRIAVAYSTQTADQVSTVLRTITPGSWTVSAAAATVVDEDSEPHWITGISTLATGELLVTSRRYSTLNAAARSWLAVFDATPGFVRQLDYTTQNRWLVPARVADETLLVFLNADAEGGGWHALDPQAGLAGTPRTFTDAAQRPAATVDRPLTAATFGDTLAVGWLDFQNREHDVFTLSALDPEAGTTRHAVVSDASFTNPKAYPKLAFDGEQLAAAWLDWHGATGMSPLALGHLYLRLYDRELSPLNAPVCVTCDATGPVLATNYELVAISRGEYRIAVRLPSVLANEHPLQFLSIRCAVPID
jgi:hypothetical protein